MIRSFTISFKLMLLMILIFQVFTAVAVDLPAFPGAEGFGRYTTGGRGGDVYHVTSLADDGSAGTLRWALNKSGRRTIVFDISGTIFLKSALAISSPNVTIAGQTAPGDGICIADYPFTINASNVIIRFIRFRLGNRNVANHEGDGLGGMDQQNIMVDHCSVSWSIDECLSVYGMKNATVQWCIASQSLRNSGHAKGAHGYGGNWGGSGASYHHNLMAHHDSRTPRLGPRASTQTDERMDMRNNVIYNWGGNGCYGGEGMNVNIVNNYYKPGPGTKQKSTAIQYRIAGIGIRTTSYVASFPSFAPMLHVWGDFFVDGNYVYGFSDVTVDNWTKGIYAQISQSSVDNLFTQTTRDTIKMLKPIDFIHTTTHSAVKAYEKVLNYAGASLSRDWLDTLMVYDTRNGLASFTGSGSGNVKGIIDSQDDNMPLDAPADWSPWPELNSAAYPADTDRDGMPDAWETAQGLNPNNAADRNSLNSEGYTMLEVYMNGLVAHIISARNEGGVIAGTTPGSGGNPVQTYLLNQTTYSGVAGASPPWTFTDGYSISNTASKAYSTGSEMGIKYSSGVQFTVGLPVGVAVDSVKFSGYDNYSEGDSYLSELNGVSFGQTTYLFNRKDANGTYTICNHTVPLQSPANGSFTFTFGGKQVVLSLLLYLSTSTDIPAYSVLPLNPDELISVYNIDGKVVRSGIARRHAVTGLLPGIYIIDRRKVLVQAR